MKLSLTVAVTLASACLLAAAKKDQYDIRPEADKAGSAPTAVVWQNDNEAALASATAEDVLADIAGTRESADKFLAQLKGAYLTDPMVAMQAAAVSQWVMGEDSWYEFWKPSRSSARKIWAKALFDKVRFSSDSYVSEFCLDQLRWCGYPCQAGCIRAFARQEGHPAVKSMAIMVANELESVKEH
jgi:hypothetical protein